MNSREARPGKIVVNRAMSLDGFIAGPGDAMGWIMEFEKQYAFPEIVAATGAMLVGRTTYEVGKRMSTGASEYDGGPVFVLTHRPPDEPAPGVTFLSCPVVDAVATVRAAARGKDVEILGADVAGQCLRGGLVDEITVYVLPVVLGDGVRFAASDVGRVDLEPFGNEQSGPVTMLRFRVRS